MSRFHPSIWARRFTYAGVLASLAALSACGGGGGDSPPPTAPSVTIALQPASITAGSTSQLTWSATGADSCSADGAWNGAVANSGDQSVTQTSGGSYTYVLTCTNAGGSTAETATLTVSVSPPAVNIAVTPATIAAGHQATLTWTVINANDCTASDGWTGFQPTSGSVPVSEYFAGSYPFSLTCVNGTQSVTAQALLTVVTPAALTTTLATSAPSVAVGQPVTLTWTSSSADTCTASGGWSGTLAISGSQTVTVSTAGSNEFYLNCISATGDGSAQVNVDGLASTASLTADVTTTGIGQAATLTWASTQASSCAASGDWSGQLPASGTRTVTPTTEGAHVYTLTCSNPGAPAQASVTVTASKPVVTLSAFPPVVVTGKTLTLRWEGQYANSCVASGAWSGTQAASGYKTLPASTLGVKNFHLVCTNAGASIPADASVTVNAAPVSPAATAYRISEAHDGVLTTSNGISYPASTTPSWTRDLGAPVSYPLIAGGKVFVTTANPDNSYGNRLFALDANTGATLWGPVAIAGVYFGSGLSYDNGKVFVLMFDGNVHAFAASNGAALWTTQLPGYWYEATPNAYGGIVFAIGNGGLSAIDESSGAILWTNQSGGSTDYNSPAISSEGAFTQSGCGTAGGFRPSDGKALWQTSLGCLGGFGYASIIKNGIVFGRGAGALNLFDAVTGAAKGQLTSATAPAITDTAVIALNSGTLSSTRLTDLAPIWTFTGDGTLAAAPLVVNGTVLIGASSGKVYGLDATSGTQVWVGNAAQPINYDSENGGPQPPSGPSAGENLLIFQAGTSLVAWKFQ